MELIKHRLREFSVREVRGQEPAVTLTSSGASSSRPSSAVERNGNGVTTGGPMHAGGGLTVESAS
jgi:hypothetical protein